MKRGIVLLILACLICIFLLTIAAADAEQGANEKNEDKGLEISNAAREHGYFSSQNWCG